MAFEFAPGVRRGLNGYGDSRQAAKETVLRQLVCRYERAFGLYARLLVPLILFALLAGRAHGNERYDRWQADKPFTLAGYGTHNYGGGGTLDVDYFINSGLNTAHDTRNNFNSKQPMVEFGDLPLFFFVYIDRMPDLEGFIADFEKARKHYKNIIGLQLGDEMKSSHGGPGLEHMRQIRDWIVNHPDPQIRNLLLITCTPAGGKMGSSEYIRNYIMNDTVDRIQPDGVLAQIYGFGGRGFYSSLQWYADWCRERGISMWVVGKTFSASRQNMPSESELRLQKFVNLAYGVRGMFDFLWCAGAEPTIRDGGYWNIDGKDNPTTLYRNVAPVNREVANIAKAIVRLRPVRAYHMDSADSEEPGSTAIHHWPDDDADLPARIRRSFRLANVTGTRNRNHLLVAFFRDDAGAEYFMVVNKDIGPATGAELVTRVTLSFHPSVKSIQRLRRDNGNVETIAVDEHYAFDLPGGTGDLFKFNTGSPFVGIEPLVLPKLVESSPAGGVLGRVEKNRIVLNFDRPAPGVEAGIHRIDDDGNAMDEDLAELFSRTAANDHRTLIYEETGAVLTNNASYRVTLYGADAQPFTIRTVRGDADGDGKVTEQDLALATQTVGPVQAGAPCDLDGDGKVNQFDLHIIRQVVEPKKFRWEDTFEDYPVGPLPGRGGWLEVETLPGGLSKSWTAPPIQVTEEHADLDGRRKLTGGPGAVGLNYRGAETLFHDGGGLGDVGQLRCGFTVRLGTQGYEDVGFVLVNSQDADGTRGNFTSRVDETTLYRTIGRGVQVINPVKHQVPSRQGRDGKGLAVEYLLDFDACTITWHWRDLNTGDASKPHMLHYRGRFIGLDGLALFIVGKDAQIDNVWVQNY